jgi:hypothetical protein
MPILEICVSDSVSVLDIFGEYFLRVKRWAEAIFEDGQPNEEANEPHETDDSPDSGTDPPTLGISVSDGIKTNDTFGTR